MSGTTEPSKASGNGTRVAIATWAPLITSVITLLIFGCAYLIAYLSKDNQTMVLMAGAVITMATTTVNHWTSGTARGGAKDDRLADTMDRQTQALAASVPLAAVPTAPAPTQGPTP